MQKVELKEGDRVPDPLVDAEVYAPALERTSRIPGGLTIDIDGVPVDLGADVRHAVIHDVHNVGWWAGNLEHPRLGSLYDLTVYNVGWQSTDRGHGHGLYTQNYGTAGVKSIDRCAFIAGFSLAWKIYGESRVGEPNKISGYTVRKTISIGDLNRDGAVIVGGRYQGVEDVVIEDCVFVGTVMLGYLGRNKRVTFRRNLVIGNLDFRPGDDLVVEDNDIVVPPGSGAYGWKASAPDAYVNPTVRRNRVFADTLPGVVNGWDTALHPLAEFPAARREYAIPEKNATLVFTYDVAGATIPAGAKVLYPPPNPVGWSGSAPSITPLRAEIAVWREEGGEGEDMARIAELEAALKVANAMIAARDGEITALDGKIVERDRQIEALTAEQAALEQELKDSETLIDDLDARLKKSEPVVAAARALRITFVICLMAEIVR